MDQLNNNVDEINVEWKWKPKKWWITLILFWFLSVTTTELVSPQNVSGLIKLYTLIIVVYAVIDDIRWESNLKKTFWVLGMWILQSLLLMPATFTVGMLVHSLGRVIFDRAINITASLPVLIWSMRKSRRFMKKENS